MKRKLLVLLAILAVTCWAAVAAADTIYLTLSTPNSGLSVLTSPYAYVEVDVPDGGGAATITFSTQAFSTAGFSFTPGGTYFLGDGSAVALNFTQANVVLSDFTWTGGNYNNFTTQPGPNNLTWFTNAGSQNVSEFGIFNATANNQDGSNAAVTSVTFTATGATNFENAASVLINNSSGFSAAAHIFNSGGTVTGYAAVPIPPTALLLGSGLLGLGLLGWRRKR